VKTLEAIRELGWSVLPLPQSSLDLAPSHFYLFGDVKNAVCGKWFGRDDEVIEEKAANTMFKLVFARRGLRYFLAGARLLK
jgi:hypothetical protein